MVPFCQAKLCKVWYTRLIVFYSSEKNHPHINHQSSILCKHKPSEQQQETQQQPSSDPTFDHQHHHHHQQQSSNDKTTKHLSSHKTDRISSPKYTTTPTRKAFSIGGLRILQFHSLCGSSLSLCLSLTAMIWQHVTLVVLAAIVTSSMVAIHSNLRHSWIKCLSTPSFWTSKHDYFLRTVAPHREAFQRTSTILLYVNARILGQLVMTTDINNNNNDNHSSHKEPTPRLLVASIMIVSWILTTMACARMVGPLSKLLLTSLDMSNGNTFCFVLPMMASVVGDYLMTNLLLLATSFSFVFAESYSCSYSYSWLSLRQLLCVQASGLIIAFLFTLAFRKHIPIRQLYWVTTAAVQGMVVVGSVQAARVFQELLVQEHCG